MNKKQITGFGIHFMLDAYNCKAAKLADKLLIQNLLEEIPKKIGMTPLGKPVIYEVTANDISIPADEGITGFVVFAESHFSIHTFPLKKYLTIDLYSCNYFDSECVEKIMFNAFQYTDKQTYLIKRGNKFVRGNKIIN